MSEGRPPSPNLTPLPVAGFLPPPMCQEYKEFIIGYRAKLSIIVRSAAAVLPEQALRVAAQRLDAAVAAATAGSGVPVERSRVLLESAVQFMESTFKAVWGDPATQEQPARLAAVAAASEPMLQRLLALQAPTGDAALLQSQGRGLESFARLLAVRRELVGPALARLFELLTGVVPLEGPGQQLPPIKSGAAGRDGLTSRQQVAGEARILLLPGIMAGRPAAPATAAALLLRWRLLPTCGALPGVLPASTHPRGCADPSPPCLSGCSRSRAAGVDQGLPGSLPAPPGGLGCAREGAVGTGTCRGYAALRRRATTLAW